MRIGLSLTSDRGESCTSASGRGLLSAKCESSAPRLPHHRPVLSPFALTGAPLLCVHVERVVSLILPVHVEPGLEVAAGLPVAASVARS